MPTSDIIVAVSTPQGSGGVAVVRLSGSGAYDLVLPFLGVDQLAPRHATFTRFCHDGQVVDELVALRYAAPHSYTGEETVELMCHGSTYIQQTLLALLIRAGARMADPGEFTLRAFRNGRLNLSQAEAVADLIEAATPAQHRLAIGQLGGGYAERLRTLRQQLLDLTSLIELELDFSQEDVEFADRSRLLDLVDEILREARRLTDSFSLGNALKQGVPVALVGQPNVGKSTLLNALLSDDRAIVSPIPGTTRDTVEGLLTIGGITFRLIDTAGLRDTDDTVERLGIERSRRAISDALVVLHICDGPATAAPHPEADGKRHITVVNKCDLHPRESATGRPDTIHLSALTGEGIEALKQALVQAVDPRAATDTLLSNARHYEALLRLQEALTAARNDLREGLPADLVAINLRDALYHLGTITGDVTSDQILDTIFSRFCVGK